jgi:hypothetical protein
MCYSICQYALFFEIDLHFPIFFVDTKNDFFTSSLLATNFCSPTIFCSLSNRSFRSAHQMKKVTQRLHPIQFIKRGRKPCAQEKGQHSTIKRQTVSWLQNLESKIFSRHSGSSRASWVYHLRWECILTTHLSNQSTCLPLSQPPSSFL